MKTCPICEKEFNTFGHNPWPITSMIKSYEGGECCDNCNSDIVTPARSLITLPFADIIKKVMAARLRK